MVIMVLMGVKKSSAGSLVSLRNQKPKKKNPSKHPVLKKILWLAPILVISAACSFFIFKHAANLLNAWQTSASIASDQKPWLITFNFENSSSSPQLVKEASQIIHRNIKTGNYENLLEISKLIQKKLQAEQVSIVHTRDHQLTLSLEERKPLLRISADQHRLVSSSEQVYGVINGKTESFETLPLLKGVFESRARDFAMKEDQTLDLEETEQGIIHDALTLNKEAEASGFKIEEIEYVKYRGFLLRTKGDNIEITIGMPPFKQRLKQLSEILNNLKKSGTQVVRIELDYNGKAFIKQKEL
jgi:hypothetical protein